MNLVNGSRLAKLAGISPAAISKAARIGRVTVHMKDGKPHYDADTALRELHDNSQPGKKRDANGGGRPRKDGAPTAPARQPIVFDKSPAPPPKDPAEIDPDQIGLPTNIRDADLFEKIYKGKLAKLKYEQEIGLLVPIDEVAATVEAEYGRVRARLLGIASKLAPDVALIDDEAGCRAIIEAAIVDALKELTADVAITEKVAA